MSVQITNRTMAIEAAASELLALLKFVSGTADDARLALMRLLDRLADTDGPKAVKQLRWLVDTVTSNYDEWPGPKTIRAVWCTEFKPADGVEADLPPGSLAAKLEQKAIEAPPRLTSQAELLDQGIRPRQIQASPEEKARLREFLGPAAKGKKPSDA